MVKNLTNTAILAAADKVYGSSRVLVDILAAKCLRILKGVLAVLAYVLVVLLKVNSLKNVVKFAQKAQFLKLRRYFNEFICKDW